MNRRGHERNGATLVAVIAMAVGYVLVLSYGGALTGVRVADGGIGIVLGLYVCSVPATSAIDILFYSGGVPRRLSVAGAVQLALNGAALLTGWLAIFAGATRLVH